MARYPLLLGLAAIVTWGLFGSVPARPVSAQDRVGGLVVRAIAAAEADEFAAAESAKNPFFKKVYDSQKSYAAKVVPAKRFMFPPYSFQADYYYPPKEK